MDTLPDKVTFGFGELGMKRNYLSAKMFLKTTDKLRGERDFGDEEDGGLVGIKNLLGELEIDIGFTGTRNAVKQFSVSFDGLEFGKGLFLSGIKGDLFTSGGSRRGICSGGGDGGWGCDPNGRGVNSGGGIGSCSGRFFATIFLDAEGEKKIGGFGDWI